MAFRNSRKTKKRVGKQVGALLLAGVMTFGMSGCGGSDRALARISADTPEEKAYTTTFVVRGDVTYQLEEELKLDNYVEEKYGLSSSVMDAMLLDDIKFDKLYVSVGDMVKEGDVLLTMSSETLNSQIDQYTEQKETAVMERQHYVNRTAIDNDEDNDMAIARCDQDITVAAGYLTELEQKRENLTVRAERDGKVIDISDQAISGTVSNSDHLLTVASGDDTYYLETKEMTTLSVGQVVTASNGILDYDVVVTNVEKSTTGSKVYFRIIDPAKASMTDAIEASLTDADPNATPGDAFEELTSDDLIIVRGLMVAVAEETRKDVLYVASGAVVEKDEHYYVFTLDEHGARVAHEVKIDSILGEYAIIKDGLEEGDEVLVE